MNRFGRSQPHFIHSIQFNSIQFNSISFNSFSACLHGTCHILIAGNSLVTLLQSTDETTRFVTALEGINYFGLANCYWSQFLATIGYNAQVAFFLVIALERLLIIVEPKWYLNFVPNIVKIIFAKKKPFLTVFFDNHMFT